MSHERGPTTGRTAANRGVPAPRRAWACDLHRPRATRETHHHIAMARYHRRMTMLNEAPRAAIDPAAGEAFADLFDALSDPTRLAVLQHLSLGEHRVRDLVDHLSLAQSTVSKHLACLRECGLVTVRAQGRASWFSLAEPELLADVLTSAQRLLAATGERVTLCTHLMHPHQHPATRAAR